MATDTVAYQCYSLDTTDAEAVAAFVARYGVQPERVIRRPGHVAVGPVPTQEAQARA